MQLRRLAAVFVGLLGLGGVAYGQRNQGLAATPPMGWNSWDSYGLTITEEQFRANVGVLATALKPYGWRYAVIDEGWFMENPQDRSKPDVLRLLIDQYGRYIPVPARFPSSAIDQGFTAIGRDVHASGLRFGIHIVRGIPRIAARMNTAVESTAFHAVDVADQSDACPWDETNWGVRDNAAGQAYYDSLFRQFAGWGVDLVKVDCISDHPYKGAEIRMIRRALDKAGRPMVLSLSPGPTALEHAPEVTELAQMWRMSDDVWDLWRYGGKGSQQGILDQFPRVAAWEKYAKPGNWPDADMLPLGQLAPMPGWGKARTSRLSYEEQKTLLTLWSMARSPLILGANLTLLDGPTTALLLNRDVIRIDQTATASHEAGRTGDLVAWTAQTPGGQALALFNAGEQAMTMDVEFARYGLGTRKFQTRDVWSGTPLGRVSGVKGVTLAPHACVLWTLRSGPTGEQDLLGEGD